MLPCRFPEFEDTRFFIILADGDRHNASGRFPEFEDTRFSIILADGDRHNAYGPFPEFEDTRFFIILAVGIVAMILRFRAIAVLR